MFLSQNIFFLFQKKHTHKRKAKGTKGEKRKTKKAKEEKDKENVVIANSICGKSNRIQYNLPISCVILTYTIESLISPACSCEFNVVHVQQEKSQYLLNYKNISTNFQD